MYTAFMDLCENITFDTEVAKEVLSKIDLSKEFTISPRWKDKAYSPMVFTPLSMAVFYTSLAMVELLLSFGANPNVIYNGYKMCYGICNIMMVKQTNRTKLVL